MFAGLLHGRALGLIWPAQNLRRESHHTSATIDGSPAATAAFRLGASSLTIPRP